MPREQISVSIDTKVLALVARYQAAQEIKPSRSQAIEALVRAGLKRLPQMAFDFEESPLPAAGVMGPKGQPTQPSSENEQP